MLTGLVWMSSYPSCNDSVQNRTLLTLRTVQHDLRFILSSGIVRSVLTWTWKNVCGYSVFTLSLEGRCLATGRSIVHAVSQMSTSNVVIPEGRLFNKLKPVKREALGRIKL